VPQKLFVKLLPKKLEIKLIIKKANNNRIIEGILGLSSPYLITKIKKAVVETIIKLRNHIAFPTVKGYIVSGDTNKGVKNNPEIDNFIIQIRYFSIST
tara:strand:+ start:4916 stop:5209 length:294 start_codon:yes stop_codon:yes gene_type:complete